MNYLFDEMITSLSRLRNKVLIVEGKKDRLALEQLGFKGNIVTLTKPIYAVIEDVASRKKEVVILTDLDKEGKQLYGKLATGLQRHGVAVDNSFRNFLIKNTRLRQIEGIAGYFER